MPTPTPIDLGIMNAGGWQPQLVTSSDQRAAQDLPAASTPEGDIVSRWRFTEEERSQIASGQDIYVFQRTFGRPVHPLSIVVGPGDGR